jgi:hypothetical protein
MYDRGGAQVKAPMEVRTLHLTSHQVGSSTLIQCIGKNNSWWLIDVFIECIESLDKYIGWLECGCA